MVVRRTPGKKIRIVNERDGDILDLTVERISCRMGVDPRLHVRLDYTPGAYEIQWLVGSGWGSTNHELTLHTSSQLCILHRNGDRMQIQVCTIGQRDAEIRLVDKPRLFRFEWSDRYVKTRG